MLNSLRFAVLSLAAACGACSSPDFDVSDRDAFVASCLRSAQEIGVERRLDANVVAELFAFVASPPRAEAIERRFDPGRPLQVAGTSALTRRNGQVACGEAFEGRANLDGMSASFAVSAGLSRWMAALSDQESDIRRSRETVVRAVEGIRQASGRLRDLISRLAPKGIRFGILKRGVKNIPLVVIQAVNPLDKPIDAFFFGIDLRRPDGGLLASGRVTFKPLAPLGPGVETTYQVELEGVPGFTDPSLVDLRDNVVVQVKVEDVVSDGVRLLADSVSDPLDNARISVLSVLLARVIETRDYARRLRVSLQ